MTTPQAQFTKKTAVTVLFLTLVFSAGVFSQETADTAYIPFVVNCFAKVTAVPASGNAGQSAEKDLGIGRVDTLVIPLGKATSVSYRPQGQANVPAAFSYSRGNAALRLQPQHYGSAEISLFSVSGKRVLRSKASASKANEINISKSNIPAGVYMLSVKGMNGKSFAGRVAHNGGKLNINIAFGGGGSFLAKSAGDYGTWRITVSATDYVDSTYDFSPEKGWNDTQYINLSYIGDTPPPPSNQIGCSRAGLEAAVNSYLAAMNAGDYTLMPLSAAAKYSEYDNASKQDYRTGSVTPSVSKFGEGLWKKPRLVDFHRSLIDTVACASFTEVIINKDSKDTTNNPPYVIGVRIDVVDGQISEIRVVVTSMLDWAFTATGYYNYSTKEDWSELPASQRLTRERLRDDAEAYFKYFSDKTVSVPWGTPPQCARLEGGAYTGDQKGATCNIGVPNLSMAIPTIWWLADVDYGTVVLFVYFGGADTHLFRILPTGYRYIHTLTAMKKSDYKAP